VISGGGTVTQAGSGKLTLTGTNLFTGTTSLAGGVLELGSAGALGSSGGISFNGGALRFTANNTTDYSARFTSGSANVVVDTNGENITFASALPGNGTGLVKQGEGTLTLGTASNLNGGSTTISGGTLYLSDWISGNIANQSALVIATGIQPFTGVISGSGTLTKVTAGTVTLSGANTYTGDTTLAGGTLVAGHATALGNGGSITFTGGTLQYGAGITTDYSSRIADSTSALNINTNGQNVTYATALDTSNSGGLVKSGSGTLAFTAANTYTGGTTVSGGTLQLGTGGSVAGNISLGSGTTLAFNRTDTTTHANTISGSGALAKSGAGAVVLTGTNSYQGGTTLSAGVLELGSADAIGTTGTLTLGGGTLRFTSANTTDYSARFATGNGQLYNLDTNGEDVTLATALTSSGGSLTKSGAGTLTLTGANTYNSGTTVSAGTLQVGNGGSTGLLAGSVSIASGGTLAFNRTGNYTVSTGAITNAGSLTFAGGGVVTLNTNLSGTGTTTLSAGTLQVDSGGSITTAVVNHGVLAFTTADFPSGVISGTGSVTKSGAGTVTFSANNTYEGGTTVSAGTLRVGNGGATGAVGTGDISVASGATLEFNRSGTLAYGGVISGDGTVAKAGAGTVVLTADHSYTGGTTVSGGILQLGNGGTAGSISGNITNNATVAFNRSDDLTYAGVISGSGSLTKSGAGILTLTGANTYNTGTSVTAGTLRVGDGGTTGSVASSINVGSGAALVFDRSNDVTYASTISASGTFTKAGAGTLTLTGENNFAGGATVSAGTVRIGAGGSVGGIGNSNVSVASGASLEFNRSGNVTYGGALTGDGSLVKSGAGTLILLGSSSLAGNSTVTGGTLQIGDVVEIINDTTTGAFAGNVDLAAGTGLVIFRHENYTHAGAITGDGALTVKGYNGPGVVTLSGNNSHTGGTTVEGRTLVLGSAGALGSTGAISLTNGGTLRHTAANTTDYSGRLASAEYQGFNIDTNGQAVTYASGFGGAGASFNKLGTGTLTLGGGNTFESLNVSAGTLALGSSAAAGGAQYFFVDSGATLDVTAAGLTLAGGQTLSGAGTVEGAVTLGESGLLSAGSSATTLTLAGGLALGGGSTLDLFLGGGAPLIVGDFLNGPEGGTITLNLYDNGGFAANTWTLIDFNGASTGGLDTEDFTFGYTIDGFDYSLAIVGSTLALTATTAIPEPGTYALFAGLLTLGCILIRRRRGPR
jgi:fibronectin-binding autotransporter adhesin